MLDLMLPLQSPYFVAPRKDALSRHRGLTTLVLAGSKDSCKTSLLFQAGISLASEGNHVTFVSAHQLTRMPLPVHGLPQPDATLLSQVNIRYMKDGGELVDYLCRIHTQVALPDVLIIDDLHRYINTSQHDEEVWERALARLCSLLKDTQTFLESKNQGSGRVVVGVGDTDLAHLKLYRKFLSHVYVIKDVSEASQPHRTLQLRHFTESPHPKQPLTSTLRVDTQHGIFLEETLFPEN